MLLAMLLIKSVLTSVRAGIHIKGKHLPINLHAVAHQTHTGYWDGNLAAICRMHGECGFLHRRMVNNFLVTAVSVQL